MIVNKLYVVQFVIKYVCIFAICLLGGEGNEYSLELCAWYV